MGSHGINSNDHKMGLARRSSTYKQMVDCEFFIANLYGGPPVKLRWDMTV